MAKKNAIESAIRNVANNKLASKFNLAQYKEGGARHEEKVKAMLHKKVCEEIVAFADSHKDIPFYFILSVGVSKGAYKMSEFEKGYKSFKADEVEMVAKMGRAYYDYNEQYGKKMSDVAIRLIMRYYERVSSLSDFPEISIVGHFDLPTKFNEREALYDVASPIYRDAAFAAMEKLNAADKIFEINSGAISRGWRTAPYPSEELLRHLNSLGGRILISSDAHSADAMTCAFDRCEALARSCGFTELWQFTGSGFEAVNIY
jgi:HisJ family histidinol phosphate phosphatase